MEVYGVIGANYGDEGKGQVTNFLCTQSNGRKIVVCTNGSSQRGHTVVHNGVRHVFHHFGSGTIDGAESYFGPDFILNPFISEAERECLEGYKIDISKCYANEECKLATVYDMFVNQVVELSRSNKHGSCGFGVFDTLKRYKNGPALTIKEISLLSSDMLHSYLNECKEYCKNRALAILKSERLPLDEYYEYEELFDNENMTHLNQETIINFLKNTELVSDSSFLSRYDTVVFENGQGLLLDQSISYKYSTPSNTGALSIKRIFDDGFLLPSGVIPKLYYVTRPYITRHGATEFKEKCDKSEINANMVDETNMPNSFQGAFLYGHLNHDELYARVMKDVCVINNAMYGLAVTHNKDYEWHGDKRPIGNLWLELE